MITREESLLIAQELRNRQAAAKCGRSVAGRNRHPRKTA